MPTIAWSTTESLYALPLPTLLPTTVTEIPGAGANYTTRSINLLCLVVGPIYCTLGPVWSYFRPKLAEGGCDTDHTGTLADSASSGVRIGGRWGYNCDNSRTQLSAWASAR